MLVSIITDASFNQKYEIGTYAFWIVSDEGRIQYSGILKKKVIRAEQAEFQCIINALHVLSLAPYAKKVKKIIIHTDCLNVIHLIQNNREEIAKYELASWGKYLVQKFSIMLVKMRIRLNKVELQHVKGHESTETKKQWVNDWCDKAAKEQMDIALKKIKSEKPNPVNRTRQDNVKEWELNRGIS